MQMFDAEKSRMFADDGNDSLLFVGISLCRFLLWLILHCALLIFLLMSSLDRWLRRKKVVYFEVGNFMANTKSIMQFLSTRINLHILCNRKSDLDFVLSLYSIGGRDEEKYKSWKITFLWLTEMPKPREPTCNEVLKEYFAYFIFFSFWYTKPYLSCCNHFWKFCVLLCSMKLSV